MSEILPGGLILRTAVPGDQEQIGALLTARGDAADAVDHALTMADPAGGWDSCAVVVDGDRVVSTTILLDETLHFAVAGGEPVVLPTGQVDQVATDREYEGRGLVRALMGWAHRRSAERGQVLGVMLGIAYFYRRFGYEYAIDIPARRAIPEELPAGPEDLIVRKAIDADLPALAALQAAAQSSSDLRMLQSPGVSRWLLHRDGSTTWAVTRDDAVIGTGRTTPPDDGLLLAEVAGDRDGVAALLSHAAALVATEPDEAPGSVADRPGTVLDELIGGWTRLDEGGLDQFYVRIPDPAALLTALGPVFAGRLAAAGLSTDEILISTFHRHYRMLVSDGMVGPAVEGGQMQSPYSVGGIGVAPDLLAALLFGPHGIHEMSQRHADVYSGPNRDLWAALFPPVTSDLLPFYLP